MADLDDAAHAVALETIEIENRAAWPAMLARLAAAGVGKRDLYRARSIAWAVRDRMKRPQAIPAE